MAEVRSSLRRALRSLARRPSWTAAVVLTLGLGIGANLAVFSLVNAALFEPLPYPHPERLVLAWEGRPDRGWACFGVSAPAFRDWQREVSGLERAAAFHEAAANVSGEGRADRVRVVRATSEIFAVLGVRPRLGRGFDESDEATGADVAILADGFWKSAFGGDPAVVGRTLRMGREILTVVGVLPPEVGPPFEAPAVFRPLSLAGDGARSSRWLTVLARLAPGRTVADVTAEMRALHEHWGAERPEDYRGWTVEVAGLGRVAREGSERTLLLLWGAVGLVLLLACANVAHLLLARTLDRERELAVRVALGAGRRALVAPLVAEGLMLGLLGGAAGLGVAVVAHGSLPAALPAATPRPEAATFGPVLLAFGLALSVLCGLLVSALPILHVFRAAPTSVLRCAGTTGATPARRRSRRALVVAEMAVAFVLLAGAGLLVRTVRRLLDVDPGFRPRGALAFRVAPPQVVPTSGQSEVEFMRTLLRDRDRAAAFYDRLTARLGALPGVAAVGAVNRLPLTGGWWVQGYEVVGRERPVPGEDRSAFGRAVTTGYFDAMRMRLRAGRGFGSGDGAGAPPVVVVDEALAHRELGDRDPLGARLRIDGRVEARVVGVVESVRTTGLDQPPSPTFYVPLSQSLFGFYPDWGMDVVLRTGDPPDRLARLARDEVRALDPTLPVFAVKTLEELLGSSLGVRRTALRLLGSFSFLALLLAAIGLSGVLSQLARERTREFGVRRALGAGGRHLAVLVVGDGLRLTGLGLLAGLLAFLAAAPALSALVQGVEPAGPSTFVAVALVMASVAVATALPTARRAARVDPVVTLREE